MDSKTSFPGNSDKSFPRGKEAFNSLRRPAPYQDSVNPDENGWSRLPSFQETARIPSLIFRSDSLPNRDFSAPQY